jgi:Tfp pilus assembly protein PilZ
VVYADAEAFAQDYAANLANGGVFVPTEADYEAREIVEVRLRLAWCDREIDLEGEVVHIVPREMIEMGGEPGVAVQFLESPAQVRDRLAPLGADPEGSSSAPLDDLRHAPRKRVRVAARIDSGAGSVWGRTRNLSRTGVLVGIEEGEIPVGERVRVVMRHPATDDELEIAGVVVRHIETEGRTSALAIHFDPQTADRETVERFVEDVQGAEHTRRLGGISGPIAELGPQSIVQMFSQTSPQGSIVLRNGEDEGVISFRGGELVLARLGSVSGMKAMVRMLTWVDGTFEFYSTVEESSVGDEPFSLQAAVFDAMRQIDESERLDLGRSFPLQARLVAVRDAALEAADDRTKVESALLDLAHAGFTVQRALEVIPEPDPEIFRALRSLIDQGALELR